MNDRFKFRVWDSANQMMSYKICFGNFFQKSKTEKEEFDWVSVSYGEDCFISYRDIGSEYNVLDYLKIQQSTGLRDKNGTLIYEGDIVKFNYDTDEIIAVVSWDNGKDATVGYYLNTTDYFKDKYVTDYDFYKNDYEVIGNIYENAELLKE